MGMKRGLSSQPGGRRRRCSWVGVGHSAEVQAADWRSDFKRPVSPSRLLGYGKEGTQSDLHLSPCALSFCPAGWVTWVLVPKLARAPSFTGHLVSLNQAATA